MKFLDKHNNSKRRSRKSYEGLEVGARIILKTNSTNIDGHFARKSAKVGSKYSKLQKTMGVSGRRERGGGRAGRFRPVTSTEWAVG